MNNELSLSFWSWLIKGYKGTAGYRQFISGWQMFHFGIGFVSATFLPFKAVGDRVWVPLTGVLLTIGITWISTVHSLVEDSSIAKVVDDQEENFVDRVYSIQLTMLVSLVTLILWILALAVVDTGNPIHSVPVKFICKGFLFSMLSLEIRETWQIVYTSNAMLIVKWVARKSSTDCDEESQ